MRRRTPTAAHLVLILSLALSGLAAKASDESDLRDLRSTVIHMDSLLETSPAKMIEPGKSALESLGSERTPATRLLELQILNRLTFALNYTKDLEAAKLYGKRASELAEVVDEPLEQGFAALNRSSGCLMERNLSGARIQLEEALKLYRRADSPSRGMAITLINLGTIDRELGDYARWIEHLHSAYRVAQAADATSQMFTVLSSLSELHLGLGQPQRALDYAHEGIALAESRGANRQLSFLLGDACRAHQALEQLALAVETCSRSLELSEELGNPLRKMAAHGQLAEVLMLQGALASSQEHVDHVFEIYRALQYDGVESQALLLLGLLQRRQQRPEAVVTLQRALEASRRLQDFEAERKSSKELAELHAEAGRYRQAHDALLAYHHLAEVMEEKKHSLAAAELRARLQTDLQEQRIKGLEQERALGAARLESLASSRRALALGAGLVLFLTVAVHARFRLQAARQRLRQARRHEEVLQTQVRERTAELITERDTVLLQAAKLKELDHAKSELFANVSHELRTPLTLTLGPIKDLRAGAFGPLSVEAEDQLSLVQRSSERLLELVEQILDVARLESGCMTVRPSPGELRSFLQDLVGALVPLAERRRITLIFEASEQPIEVYYDPEMMVKVFTNLVGNALKFTPEGGVVSVSLMDTRSAKGHPQEEAPICVEVRDNGPGLPAEEREKVFDRFYQVEGSRARRSPGSGLGLTLARDLIELHGGRIEVESEVGCGTLFTVRLRHGCSHFSASDVSASPVAVETLPPLTVPSWSMSSPEVELAEPEEDRATILVVDDNPEVRAYVRRHLVNLYRVIEAEDGAQALERAREQLPDLVISDIMMPGIDGIELCRRLKADPELGHVPLILLTARADSEDRVDGLEAGADDYLAKPFEVRELLARIANLIATSRRLLERRPPLETPALETESGPSADQAFLDRVWRVIEEHLGDEEFSVDVMAQHLSMDRSHLYRRLRTLVGISPSDLIRSLRLKQAEALLRQHRGSVSEIAHQVGFRSVSQFSRSFRRTYGIAPSQFLKESEPPTVSFHP